MFAKGLAGFCTAPCVVRDRSWTPSACSTRARRRLTIDFDTPNLRAAGETPPASTTSRNVRTSANVQDTSGRSSKFRRRSVCLPLILFRDLPEAMKRMIRYVIVAFVFALSGWHVQAKEPVDLLLVLAADVSRSIDTDKFKLQREGYAAAFNDPRVVNVITSGLHGQIAVCFVKWSGASAQRLVIDWALIKDLDSARQFGDQLSEIPRSFADSTSISGGLDFALAQFAGVPFDAARRTIDVSGDGNNNSGRDVRSARDEAVVAGVTVNGLVILTDPLWASEHTNPPGGLENYYRENVIGGAGAFVLVARDFNSFGNMLIKKLIAEIALIEPRGEVLPR